MLVHPARIVFVCIAICLSLFGCGNDKAPTATAPKKGAQDNNANASGDPGTQERPPSWQTPETVELRIGPASGTGTTFEFDTLESISIAFEVTGDEGRAVGVALLDAPSGADLRGANSSQPTFSWTSPRRGTHSFRFLLRDMDGCKKAKGSLSACELSDNQGSSSEPYDTTSARFTLEIGNGSDTDLSSGGGSGDLISQILQGLGGSGGADGNLQGLLQGLSSGQLQSILQGQSSGLDLASLIQLITGFGLTGTEAAGSDEG